MSWSQSLVVKRSDESQPRSTRGGGEDSIYISSAGRVFEIIRSIRRSSVASSEQAPGSTKDSFGAPQAAHFEGRTLLVDTRFVSGARRIVIDFDDAFQTCNAKVIHGKEAGAKPVITMSWRHPGVLRELKSIEVQNLSCAIKDGNVFGGQ